MTDKGRAILIAAAAVLGLPGAQTEAAPGKVETAVLAGGCFWGVEGVFEHVKGVRNVVSGFAGGAPRGLDRTGSARGHVEAVRISFDPAQISYAQLLEIFFNVAHDPTQVDRQGPDVGPRYRSAIFPQDGAQRQAAQRHIAQLRASGRFARPIATRLESGAFKVAGPEHQDYVRKHPTARYVVVNDLPKLAKLKRSYPILWRE